MTNIYQSLFFIDTEGCEKRAACRVAECNGTTIGCSPYCYCHHPDNLQEGVVCFLVG